ncbi:MAG TPA: DUF4974 domain-containing protein, partial [Niastella sp.]|nr:DUF4974 domain-containing protein [Niastella sp.]
QQADVLHDQLRLKVSKASIDEAVAWKSGYFLFDNQDIRTIMKMISRWYDVDVEYGAIHQEEFLGGSFSRTANIKELLYNLEAISHTRFTIKERRIIVTN